MKYHQKHLSKCLLAIAALLGGASTGLCPGVTGCGVGLLGPWWHGCNLYRRLRGRKRGYLPGITASYTNTGCTIAGATPLRPTRAAASAHADFLNAYAAIRFQSCIQMPGDLSAQFLAPGVYCTNAVAKTGTLTLTGPSNGVWVFLVDGALTGTNFSVVMAGGAQPANVFWAPSAGTTMTTSVIQGIILAGDAVAGSITFTGGTLVGRALANVAVTLTTTSVIGQ